jgi:hypothetical protein
MVLHGWGINLGIMLTLSTGVMVSDGRILVHQLQYWYLVQLYEGFWSVLVFAV